MTGLAYLLPLVFVVSLVYEATHAEDMPVILRKGLRLFLTMSVGLVLLAAVMLLLGRTL